MFEQKLKKGFIGESLISRWFQSRGYSVLPAYDVEQNSGKGPRLFVSDGRQLISPDMLVFKSDKILWVEAKHKSAFTWHRMSETWQTGIDRRHWGDYLKVAEVAPFPVWILFLQRDGVAKDTPKGMTSPTGLFGNEISELLKSIHHEHEKHGPTGMVYWTRQALLKVADLKDVLPNP